MEGGRFGSLPPLPASVGSPRPVVDLCCFGLIERLRRRAFFLGVRAMQLCHAGDEPEFANDPPVVFALCVRLQGLPINEMPIGHRRGQIDEAFLWSQSRHFLVPVSRRLVRIDAWIGASFHTL